MKLKLDRLRVSGFDVDEIMPGQVVESKQGGRFIKIDLADRDELQKLFKNERFDAVCHLAGSAWRALQP